MTNKPFRVVLLCGGGFSSKVIYHALTKHFDIAGIVVENSPSARRLLLRRVRRLGLLTVLGQVLFMVLNRLLKPLARQRISELIVGNGLSDDGFPPEKVHNVLSANDARTIVLLNELQPDVVVVNGTRIISGEVLNCVAVPFINTHMGITPKYRGVHGGYWALASGDRDNCGVTVHLVDQGIDTGDVLYQGLIATTNDDTFNTYPVHQIAAAIPLMIKALNDLRLGQLISRPGVLPSQLWSHPTLWNYFWNWVSKGVR